MSGKATGFNLRLVAIPVVLALILRYGPRAFYGNRRVYDEPIPYEIMDDFLLEDTVLDLRDWVKNERRFATAVEASNAGVNSIGEDEPRNPDGTCDEKLFVSTDGSPCHFGGRIDIFGHFIRNGGFYGAKETVAKLWSSVYAFINYYPNAVKEERIIKLFKSEEYQSKVNNICKSGFKAKGQIPEGDVTFRPTQVNIVLIPPGQDLPIHQDNQWFWGINQRSVPDWLLHVMHESRLFEDLMIPQAQGVAYLHGTKEQPYFKHGGRYVFYPNGPGKPAQSLPPKRGQAIIMDGGRMLHGVERTHPGRLVGHLRPGAFNRVEYQGNDTWYMMSDSDLVEVFKTDDFRMTFVWRGLCFRDDEEQEKFEHQLKNEEYTDTNIILKKLEEDLHKNGKLSPSKGLATMGPKAFGILLQNVYMQYPLDAPDAWFPFNFCLAGHQKPWVEWLLSPFCTDITPRNPQNDLHPAPMRFCDPQNRTRRMTECPGGFQGQI